MNTTPDELTLARWLDDDLDGAELEAMEAWAAKHPEQLAAREESRRWRGWITTAVPAEIEPPYAEFFNHRIARAIRANSTSNATPALATPARTPWRHFFIPLTACAGMVIAFLLGARIQSSHPEIDVAGAPRAIPVDLLPYTPDLDVEAEYFKSPGAAAMVIVLNGVGAIPDSLELIQTASVSQEEDEERPMASAPQNPQSSGS
ncbi:MAG: hypothetical protein FJ385_04195 [Verrucomicrobia bacterium]|nr:hypothetical protein [Verrucomicrobiota bacterium]